MSTSARRWCSPTCPGFSTLFQTANRRRSSSCSTNSSPSSIDCVGCRRLAWLSPTPEFNILFRSRNFEPCTFLGFETCTFPSLLMLLLSNTCVLKYYLFLSPHIKRNSPYYSSVHVRLLEWPVLLWYSPVKNAKPTFEGRANDHNLLQSSKHLKVMMSAQCL